MKSPYGSQSPVELHNATPSNYITIYVLLSGVAGGLGIVLAVLICCKVCFRKRKKLYRKTVVLVHSSPEKEKTTKFASPESSSINELDNLYYYSEYSPAHHGLPDEDLKVEVELTRVDDRTCDSKRSDAVERRESGSDYSAVRQSPANGHNSSQNSTVIEVESRRRSSGGLQRQSSICIPDSDENLDIILAESNVLADIASLEKLHGSNSKQSRCCSYNISQNSSLDMEQEPTQISVEVHRGCSADASDAPTQQTWVPNSKEGCGRTMDLEDYHYSQTHGTSNVASWLLGNSKKSASTYDVVRSAEVVRWRDALQRTASVESSDLEELMENRRKKNSHNVARQSSSAGTSVTWSDEDDEPKSKVRYNDTGSKEEVNEDVLDLFVEDIDLIEMDDFTISATMSMSDMIGPDKSSLTSEKISAQYRELWQLRATLEEEDLSDVTCFEDDNCDSVKKAFGKDETLMDVGTPSQDSSQYSETSPGDPNDKSDCSNEASGEAKDVPSTEGCRSKQGSTSMLLEPPSCHSRRQSYKSILTRRMHQTESVGGQTTSLDSVGPPSTENSFDSIETVDTEGGSTTDASRPEAISTSFESTTDNTDSPSDTHTHNRLQQMKADSGYKSIEIQNGAKKAPRLSKKKLYFVLDDISIENVPPEQTTVSIDEGVEVTEVMSNIDSASIDQPTVVSSPPAVLSDMKTLGNSLIKKERARKGSHLSLSALERREGKSASKKRREYIKDRQPSLGSSVSVGELNYRVTDIGQGCETDSRSDQQSGPDSFDEGTKLPPVACNPKSSVFLRFFRSSYRSNRSRIQFRDYSIDEKSDSLFREFSRHDPSLETSIECLMRTRSPRLHPGHSARRFHHRCRQMKRESGSPRAGRRKLSPQDSIEEETSHAESEQECCDSQFSGGSISLQKSSEESLLDQAVTIAEIPIIELVHEDSNK